MGTELGGLKVQADPLDGGVELVPGTLRGVDLPGLQLTLCTEVTGILPDEVHEDTVHTGVSRPVEPVFHGRLQIDRPETVSLRGVQLVDRVFGRGIDCRVDSSLRVQLVSVELEVQGDLHGGVQDLGSSAVELVQEEDAGILAAVHEPVRRAESSGTVRELRKAEEVALGHLAEAAVDQLKTQLVRDLGEDLGLTDAVRASDHDGLSGGDLGDDVDGGLDVHGWLLVP